MPEMLVSSYVSTMAAELCCEYKAIGERITNPSQGSVRSIGQMTSTVQTGDSLDMLTSLELSYI